MSRKEYLQTGPVLPEEERPGGRRAPGQGVRFPLPTGGQARQYLPKVELPLPLGQAAQEALELQRQMQADTERELQRQMQAAIARAQQEAAPLQPIQGIPRYDDKQVPGLAAGVQRARQSAQYNATHQRQGIPRYDDENIPGLPAGVQRARQNAQNNATYQRKPQPGLPRYDDGDIPGMALGVQQAGRELQERLDAQKPQRSAYGMPRYDDGVIPGLSPQEMAGQQWAVRQQGQLGWYNGPGADLSGLDDSAVLAYYADPTVRLNLADQARAEEAIQRLGAGQYGATDRLTGAPWVGAFGQGDLSLADYQNIQEVEAKMNPLAAMVGGASDALYVDEALDAFHRQRTGEEGGYGEALEGLRLQHPEAYEAGRMGGTALEYWAGAELMKSLPVAGELSQAMGGWLNSRVGPLLPGGASPAGEAMFSRLSADTLLDLGLDTMPHFLEDLKNGLPVGEAGARALWSILGNTAGNAGSELAGQYLDRLLVGSNSGHPLDSSLGSSYRRETFSENMVATLKEMGYSEHEIANLRMQGIPLDAIPNTLTRTQKSRMTALNNTVRDHLLVKDFTGTLGDLQGNPIHRYAGEDFQHLYEMTCTYRSIYKIQESIEKSLRNPHLSTIDRMLLEEALQEADFYIWQIKDLFKEYGGIELWEKRKR